MKKYNINYLKRFTAKNGKDYVSMELQSQVPSVNNEGEMLGYKTYSIIASAEKVPSSYMYGGTAECSLSVDKKTGAPFAYNFKVLQTEMEQQEKKTSNEPDDDLPF